MSMNYNRRPFFTGRYGADELSVTLGVLGILFYLAYPIFDEKYIQAIFVVAAIALALLVVFRSLSSNIGKRRRENEVFLSLFRTESKEEKKRRKEEERIKREKRKEEEKTYAFFRCPKCKKELRVPKNKGKIRIKCPNCGEQFIRRT